MSLPVDLARAAGHAIMGPFEKRLSRDKGRPTPPPVFIIGPPRSGTTLLYESMITAFRLAFISNAAHRFYRTPLAATWLLRSRIAQWEGGFTSRYGHIEGWAAPNEGGWVWRRWLPDGDWTNGTELDEAIIAGPHALSAGISTILGAPFINKNVMHSNRLLTMRRIWPDARYIVVRRDVAENARSIIRAERANRGAEAESGEWFSVKPRLAANWSGRSVVERAVAQVIGVHRDIATDAPKVGEDRFHNVDYARLCAAPRAIMEDVATFLSRTGGAPERRGSLPEEFRNASKLLDEEDEAAIARSMEELGNT